MALRLLTGVADWVAARRTARELGRLSRHMLLDIGAVTEEQARRAPARHGFALAPDLLFDLRDPQPMMVSGPATPRTAPPAGRASLPRRWSPQPA